MPVGHARAAAVALTHSPVRVRTVATMIELSPVSRRLHVVEGLVRCPVVSAAKRVEPAIRVSCPVPSVSAG
jgi:hypothetical protein